MKILHATAPAEVGGLESVVHGLALGHRERGHDVHVAAVVHRSRRNGDPFLDPLREGGVAVHEVVVPPRGYVREVRRMGRLLGRIRPDVVHTHGPRPDLVDGWASRRRGLPTVTTVHGYDLDGTRERVREWIQAWSLRRHDAVVAVSRPLVDRLRTRGVPGDRIHCVRNAWRPGPPPLEPGEARRRLGLTPDPLHLGWVGRLEAEKGPDVFLQALERLEDLPLVASVLGSGSMECSLRERSGASGLDGRIRWHGVVPGAARVLPAFDLLVLSSRTEGTPIVLFEAMAAGVPVVATRVGGVPDVLSDREAVLVPPEDPDALAGAIRRAAEDPCASRERAEAAGRRLRNEFAAGPWLRRYEDIYRDISRSPEG